jgi:hypothetical protein
VLRGDAITAIATHVARTGTRDMSLAPICPFVSRALYLNSAALDKHQPLVPSTLWAQARIRPKSCRASGAGPM